VGQVAEGASGPLTVIVGPPGSGKTALARLWLESRPAGQLAAWVSVERGERDPQRFWNAVGEAVRAAGAGGSTIETPAPTPDFDHAEAVRRLFAGLATHGRDVVLLIDDAHEIADPAILEQLGYALDHLPGALHLVLISRRDPPLGLHKRRLDGSLTEIRADELRFTLEETRELLGSFGAELSPRGLALLHDRTEGWAAGVRLAALSLTRHPDPERFVAEFSGSERTVAEYLLAEVLDAQPPAVRRLLLRASLLKRVNGELADALTGETGSEARLRSLAESGAFVVAIDTKRAWFRFHHLFADLLALELRATEPDAIPELHAAAATWLAAHGDAVEAIAHAQAAGNDDQVAELLIHHYFSLTLDGLGATARTMIQAYIAGGGVESAEIATVMAADEMVDGSLDQAAAHLALAQRLAPTVPEHRRHRFEMALLVTRLSLAQRLGDFRSVVDAVPSPGSLTEPRTSFEISMVNDVRVLVLMNLGIVEVWSGHLADGERHLVEARDLAERIGRPYLQVSCQAHLAHALSWKSFTLGRDAAREALELAEQHAWDSDPVAGPALVTLGGTLLEAGRIDEGEEALLRAAATLRADLQPAAGFLLHTMLGVAAVVRGRYREGLASYRAAERLGLVLVSGSPLQMQMRSSQLTAMLAAGEIAAVRAAIAEMSESERDLGVMRLVVAATALADGDAEAALDAAAPAIDGRAEAYHPLVVVHALLLAAQARAALGDPLAAEEAVERALGLAEPDALILPFLYRNSRELLEQHPRHRTAHGAFVAEILDAFSGRHAGAADDAPAGPLEALSDAELRVLRLLPTNLPASGIAAEIYVSTNTVKTHMRHIYAKLNAHTRSEAVTRARGLGLLGRSSRHG
jgi:LuxR family maltose regulon positive regulatory protein